MKVLSNVPTLAPWQKVEQVAPSLTAWEPIKIDQGHPLSVLPDAVQDSLRAGFSVALERIVPVPQR